MKCQCKNCTLAASYAVIFNNQKFFVCEECLNKIFRQVKVTAYWPLSINKPKKKGGIYGS